MSAGTAVVMAYRDMGCPHRARAFAYTHGWYSAMGWPIIVEAGTGDATFGRAAAINAAVARADAQVIVQADPDSLVPEATLCGAVAAASFADGLVVPHDRYLYLNQAATAQLYAGQRDPARMTPADTETHGRHGVGNVVVFSRTTWQRCGGFDERFGLWGGDDAAFAYAAAAFCGATRRAVGDMVHLWHPRLPQSEPGHPGYAAQFAIVAQYRDAAAIGDAAVRALVAGR